MQRPRALVIGGESSVRATIQAALEPHAVEVHGADGPAEIRKTLEELRESPLHAVFVDLDAEVGDNGVLDLVRGLTPAPVLLGIVSNPLAREALEFIRSGGFDVLAKPIDSTALAMLSERLKRQLGLETELETLRRALRCREGYDRLVGRSAAMERVREQLEVFAHNELAVWFAGEAGTGKALAARSAHLASQRAARPFVVVACADLAHGVSQGHWLLAEAPLAGSPLEQARGGSLLLEDVTQLPPELQARLLTLLEADPVHRDAPRLFAASSRDPRREIDQGRLLDRLYRRLSATTLNLPPLRERGGDVPVLARYFISVIVEINHLPPIQLSPDALALLESYTWPGNVQELRNAIEHAVILVGDGVIRPRDLPDWIHDTPAVAGLPRGAGELRRFREAKRDVVESFESDYLTELLRQHVGNVTTAAQQAGMLRSALQRLLRKHGLKSASFRQERPALAHRESRPDPSLAE